MGLEIYAERPATESLVAAGLGAVAAAGVATLGARAFIKEYDGERELHPLATLAVAAAAYATSWAVDTFVRGAFQRKNP